MRPKVKVVEGIDFKWAPAFPDDHIRSAVNYKARPDDLFIATYPKCGTTWMQEIVYLLFHDGVPRPNEESISKYSPFLESLGAEWAETMPRPGAIKTHIPRHLHPYHPTAKYIIVARNPKDACVSFYYHTKGRKHYEFADGTFPDFVKAYVAGEVEGGDFCDFYLSWWPQIVAKDPHIHFVLYEDLKADTRGQVIELAKFIGGEALVNKLLANDEDMLRKVIENSAFDKMQAHYLYQDSLRGDRKPFYPHVRKGVVGDWKNHFNEEDNRLIEDWFFRKTANTGIDRLWDNYQGIFER